MEYLVDSGLHRLSVSVHTMDAAQFPAIYRRGEISGLRNRLDDLREYKRMRGSKYPEIDFAFVAMRENLSQLSPVVEYAASLGVTQVSIHPVIRRGAAPLQFAVEIDGDGMLRHEFAAQVRDAVSQVSVRYPHVTIAVARPDPVKAIDQPGITTCEQNAWETIHVLADGAIVVCEVQDRVEMGSLRSQSLTEIWNGPQYREFRRQYIHGAHPARLACPWRRTVPLETVKKVMVRGWHPPNGETVEWSQASAVIAIGTRPGATGIRLSGILPPPPNGSASNALSIRHGTVEVAHFVNGTAGTLSFDTVLPARGVLQFETKHRFCPAEQGHGPDIRNLGFALTDFTFEYGRHRKNSVSRLIDTLHHADRLVRLRPAMRWAAPAASFAPAPGVTVIVPARDTPDLLPPMLAAAEAALSEIDEPSELIVVISGAAPPAYADLRRRFPRVIWIFRLDPLDYAAAVELGIAHSRYPWFYLLNSDMHLQPAALMEILKLRRADTFAIGSRIRMRDGSKTETNWADFRYCEKDAAELIERDPENLREPRGCLYVGGGSGLFRASLLKRFIKRTRAYAPFYWEDVEWGARAWREGYRCLFCPASEAIHHHRQTVSRYYIEPEVRRIFGRNRVVFGPAELEGHLSTQFSHPHRLGQGILFHGATWGGVTGRSLEAQLVGVPFPDIPRT
jgi:GT2 family glycosyltransferase